MLTTPSTFDAAERVLMPLFELTADALEAIPPTDFATEGIWERRDPQRLLRDNIATVDESLLVIAEEFGDFEGSERRIDLLCIDQDARVVAAGFGTEITTTVLWLITTHTLDITCIRLVPHRVGDRLPLDITQLIPLPEAEEFTIRLRRREQAARAASSGRDWTQYVISTPHGESKPLRKRWAILELIQALHSAGVPMTAIAGVVPGSRIISAPGTLTGTDLIKTPGAGNPSPPSTGSSNSRPTKASATERRPSHPHSPTVWHLDVGQQKSWWRGLPLIEHG
jgi:hypothetical protein